MENEGNDCVFRTIEDIMRTLYDKAQAVQKLQSAKAVY